MTVTVTGDGKATLLDLLRTARVPTLPESPCGGKGRCGKCAVRVGEARSAGYPSGGIPEPCAADLRLVPTGDLARGVRLACQCVPSGPCTVELEERAAPEGYRAVSSYRVPSFLIDGFRARYARGLGVAIDIGTTTIAMELLDMKSGAVLARDARLNDQRRFGADVLSRVRAAGEGHAAELRDAVRSGILRGIAALFSQAHLAPASLADAREATLSLGVNDLCAVALAGNTVMIHLFFGLPVESLGRAPFTPAATRFSGLSFREVFGGLPVGAETGEALLTGETPPDCPVFVVPCASAFIGGDVIAGLAALDLRGAEGPELFVDLGTNAEMVLVKPGAYYCASAAAGPAFEGSSISCGTGSVPGAVSSVRVEGGRFSFERIPGADDAPPVGLCGSGLIDFVACALSLSLIKEDGSLSPVCAASGVFLDPSGVIALSARDVREVQLAKAAIRAAIAVLLEESGTDAREVVRVHLAGGFGLYLREESAIAIGLFPKAFAGKTVPAGNVSLAGSSRLVVDAALESRFDAILSEVNLVDLAGNSRFGALFVDSMGFGPSESPA